MSQGAANSDAVTNRLPSSTTIQPSLLSSSATPEGTNSFDGLFNDTEISDTTAGLRDSVRTSSRKESGADTSVTPIDIQNDDQHSLDTLSYDQQSRKAINRPFFDEPTNIGMLDTPAELSDSVPRFGGRGTVVDTAMAQTEKDDEYQPSFDSSSDDNQPRKAKIPALNVRRKSNTMPDTDVGLRDPVRRSGGRKRGADESVPPIEMDDDNRLSLNTSTGSQQQTKVSVSTLLQ